jgi:sulfur-oxidizing protein SoxX
MRASSSTGIVGAILLVLGLSGPLWVFASNEGEAAAAGKALCFDPQKGNCLACHVIAGGESPGNIGPQLIDIRTRFPDRKALHAQIRDATIRNPETIMPPFGRHHILSEQEIDQVVAFVWTL